MKAVDLEKLKAQIPERGFDRAAEKSPFFVMGDQHGHARALWNFTVALMDAEVGDLETAYRIADESKDLAHLCGFHKLRWRHTRWQEMRYFFSKLWYDPNLITLKPQLREYIEHICENSRVQWGRYTRPMGLMHVLDIEDCENLPWRTPEWLKLRRPAYVPHPRVPLMEFYPYIAKAPTEEHELLLAVDRIVGRTLAPEWRGDFCQDLIVSILSGDLEVGNLHDEMPNYLKRFKREMPNKYKEISIDALIFSQDGGSGRTFGDYLVAKPDEDLTDEDVHLRPLTGRYGQAINDCQTVSDYAERLQDAWEANRLSEESRRTYSRFDRLETNYGDPEYGRLRRKYQVVNKRVRTQEYERERFGGAWSPETALPDELRAASNANMIAK